MGASPQLLDTETGELQERRLEHREEAEKFYRDLAAQEMKVRVGMEASGHARWFERLLSELQCELWIGDAAAIRGKARKSRWCGVKHRVIDWVSRSPSRGVRSSNHDRRCDRRDAWVGLSF